MIRAKKCGPMVWLVEQRERSSFAARSHAPLNFTKSTKSRFRV